MFKLDANEVKDHMINEMRASMTNSSEDNIFVVDEVYRTYVGENTLISYPKFEYSRRIQGIKYIIDRNEKMSLIALSLKKVHMFFIIKEGEQFYISTQCSVQRMNTPNVKHKYIFTQFAPEPREAKFKDLWTCNNDNVYKVLCIRKQRQKKETIIDVLNKYKDCFETFASNVEKISKNNTWKSRIDKEYIFNDTVHDHLCLNDIPSSSLTFLYHMCMLGMKNIKVLPGSTDNSSLYYSNHQKFLHTCYFNNDEHYYITFSHGNTKSSKFLVIKVDVLENLNDKDQTIDIVEVNTAVELYFYDNTFEKRVLKLYTDNDNDDETIYLKFDDKYHEVQVSTSNKMYFTVHNKQILEEQTGNTLFLKTLMIDKKEKCDVKNNQYTVQEESVWSSKNIKKKYRLDYQNDGFYTHEIFKLVWDSNGGGIINLRQNFIDTWTLYLLPKVAAAKNLSTTDKENVLDLIKKCMQILQDVLEVFVTNNNTIVLFYKNLRQALFRNLTDFDQERVAEINRTFMNYKTDVFQTISVYSGIISKIEKQRLMFLSRHEIDIFVQDLYKIVENSDEDEETQQMARYVLLLIATGCRQGEITNSALVFHDEEFAVEEDIFTQEDEDKKNDT